MRLRVFYILLILLGNFFTVHGEIYTVNTVPNVKLSCATCFVTNPDAILSPSATATLDAKLMHLQDVTGVEVAIVVLESIGYEDFTDFSYQLFNHWGLGQAGKNTGVLVLFIADDRAVKIETGYGIEGLLPDGVCSQILNETMFPLFKQGNYDAGFIAGIDQIAELLTTEEALAELLLNQNSRKNTVGEAVAVYLTIGFLLLIVLALYSFSVLNWEPTAANNVRYQHMKALYSSSLVAAMLFPLPLLLFFLWIKVQRRQIRRKPVLCDKCQYTMHLLTEKEEDSYLKANQLKEEELRSVDYDVWLCNHCSNNIALPYQRFNVQYSACPYCQTKAYHLQDDRVTLRATQFRQGQGVKTYGCDYCHKQKQSIYVIPQLVVVSSSGGFGGSGKGGGFGGGSWGGGMSGGGGAGGRF